MARIALASFARAGEVNSSPQTWYTQGHATLDDSTLFLEKFGGQVLTTFAETNVMMPLHTVQSISSGKSASFPVVGQAKASYHAPGNDILVDVNLDTTTGLDHLQAAAQGSVTELQDIRHNEVTIYIDGILTSSVFVHDLDVAMNHWDQMSVYSEELGRALAKAFDVHVMMTTLGAAEVTTPTITGGNAGETIVDADFKTNGASAVDTIFTIAQKFDEKDIPKDGRYIIVDPATFYKIAQQTDLVNKDLGDGNGDFPSAMVRECAGIKIVMSNHLPSTDLSATELLEVANTSVNTNMPYLEGYTDNNWSNTAAIAFHKSAVGTVKLMDLSVQKEYITARQGTLMVARYAMGHGILRPEAAIAVDIA